MKLIDPPDTTTTAFEEEEITGVANEVPENPYTIFSQIPDKLEELSEEAAHLSRGLKNVARQFRMSSSVLHTHGAAIERLERKVHKIECAMPIDLDAVLDEPYSYLTEDRDPRG